MAAALLRLFHGQRLPQRLAAGRGRGRLQQSAGRGHLRLEGKEKLLFVPKSAAGAVRTGACGQPSGCRRACPTRSLRQGWDPRCSRPSSLPGRASAIPGRDERGRPTPGFVLLMRRGHWPGSGSQWAGERGVPRRAGEGRPTLCFRTCTSFAPRLGCSELSELGALWSRSGPVVHSSSPQLCRVPGLPEWGPGALGRDAPPLVAALFLLGWAVLPHLHPTPDS